MGFYYQQSEIAPIRNHRVPQTIETPVTFVMAPGAYIRYAYSRSNDSMASWLEGQDYLCFQHNDQRLVLAICDGVGSSFCGQLAARILGDSLLEWLWSVDITYINGASALGEAAKGVINRLQKQAQYEVEAYQMPQQMSPLVRQALESQRTYGSETVFAGVRIDYPSPTIPDGLLSVCWMGDTQVRVFGDDGKEIKIGGRWDNSNRWSTTQGARGQMSAWMQALTGIGRVIGFTDGLAAHASRLAEYPDDRLDRELRESIRLPTSDDAAFIDVVVRTPYFEGYPDPELPDLNMERPQLEHIWNPRGADTYELRWNWPGQPNASFMIQEARSPALADSRVLNVIAKETKWQPDSPQSPGRYYYRIRAVNRRGIVSPWSELREASVAFPPPPAPELRVAHTNSSYSLEWAVEGEALDFLLEQSDIPGFAESVAVYSGRATSWTLPSGEYEAGVHYFRVRAISNGGEGEWSAIQKIEIRLPPPPTPHLALIASDDQGGYELRWQSIPGATRYELEAVTSSSKPQIETLTVQQHLVRHQYPGIFSYRVRACNDSACSEWSNEQRIVVNPDAPEWIKWIYQPDSATIRIIWQEVEQPAQYTLQSSSENDDFHDIYAGAEAHYTLAMPSGNGQTFLFRVNAQMGELQSNWAVSTPFQVPGDARIAPPSIKPINPVRSGDIFEVAWNGIADSAYYELQGSISDLFDQTRTSSVKITHPSEKYAVSGRPSGTYFYRVRAVNAQGQPGAWSNTMIVNIEQADS